MTAITTLQLHSAEHAALHLRQVPRAVADANNTQQRRSNELRKVPSGETRTWLLNFECNENTAAEGLAHATAADLLISIAERRAVEFAVPTRSIGALGTTIW